MTVLPIDVVVVIDALDECKDDTDMRKILRLLVRIREVILLSLRIFITSRPELPIQLGFCDINRELHRDIVLEEVQATTIETDIRTYFKHQFMEIKKRDSLRRRYDTLPVCWPGKDSITRRCGRGM